MAGSNLTNPISIDDRQPKFNTFTEVLSDVKIAAVSDHVLMLTEAGYVLVKGSNMYGQCGIGSSGNFVDLMGLNLPPGDIVGVATGGYADDEAKGGSLLIKRNGTLWSMGANTHGQIAGSTKQFLPTLMFSGNKKVTAAAINGVHSLFTTEDGVLYGSGNDGNGELAGCNGGYSTREPKEIARDVISFAAGRSHSAWVKADGSLWTCGSNMDGQLGDDQITLGRHTPYKADVGVVMVAAGANHTLYIKRDHSLWGMGDNGAGQLGDGTTYLRPLPVKIADNVQSVCAGLAHTLFIKLDGTLWGMGDNYDGQLGDGTYALRRVPVKIADNVRSASAGVNVSGYVTGNPRAQISWVNPRSITYGTPLSRSHLNATASIPGTFSYTPAEGAILSAGNQILNVIFTPDDAENYDPTYAFVEISVTQPAIQISLQPVSQTTQLGGSATFSILASGAALLGYQWQISADGGAMWADLHNGPQYAGSTTATLIVNQVTASMHGNQYRCLVSDGLNPAVVSSPAALTIAAPVITAQPTAATTNAGVDAMFSVTVTSSLPLGYQWQVSADGGATWSNVSDGVAYSGATTSGLTVLRPMQALNGTQYRCQISDGLNRAVVSMPVALTVSVPLPPEITVAPVAATTKAGTNATFSVTATSAVALGYQWQVSTDGSTWSDVSNGAAYAGATTSSLTVLKPTGAMKGYQYRCVLSDNANAAIASAPATLTVQ